MKIGDLVSYQGRYYGIVTEIQDDDEGGYYEYGDGFAGVSVVWIDSGFKSWEFESLLEIVSEGR